MGLGWWFWWWGRIEAKKSEAMRLPATWGGQDRIKEVFDKSKIKDFSCFQSEIEKTFF